MSFGLSDRVLNPVVVLPVQFQLIWAHSRSSSPAHLLALAVLEQALADLRDQRFAQTRRGQRLYWEAYQWITADDREWPYSFANLCAAVGLDIDAVRRCILDPTVSSLTPAVESVGKAA